MLVDINLLPQKERDRPAFLIAALSILLVGIIAFAVLFFMAKGEAAEGAALEAQSADITLQQAELRAQLEATSGMNEEQQLAATVDWAESYQYDTIPLLEELARLLPARGFFDQITFSEPNTATLIVQFDATRDAAYYLAQLKGSELLDFASLDSVESQSSLLTDEEEDEAKEEDETIETPRYLATYTLVFVDDRLPVLDAEGNIVEEAAEEETPAAETEEAADTEVDVDVEVNEETETAPEETEGDSNE